VYECIAYVTDIACTLALFFQGSPQASHVFAEDPKMFHLIASIHDQVLPILEEASNSKHGGGGKDADFDIISMALVDVTFGMLGLNRLRNSGTSPAQKELIMERFESLPTFNSPMILNLFPSFQASHLARLVVLL